MVLMFKPWWTSGLFKPNLFAICSMSFDHHGFFPGYHPSCERVLEIPRPARNNIVDKSALESLYEVAERTRNFTEFWQFSAPSVVYVLFTNHPIFNRNWRVHAMWCFVQNVWSSYIFLGCGLGCIGSHKSLNTVHFVQCLHCLCFNFLQICTVFEILYLVEWCKWTLMRPENHEFWSILGLVHFVKYSVHTLYSLLYSEFPQIPTERVTMASRNNANKVSAKVL